MTIALPHGPGRCEIKICGITRTEDAEGASRLGVDLLGFVFWPRSKRCVAPGTAETLAARAKALSPVRTVGVFVDEEAAGVATVAAVCGLDFAQLHGSETPEYVCGLKQRLGMATRIIKALKAGAGEDWSAYVDAGVDLLLLDSYDPVSVGGTGRAFDIACIPADLPRERLVLAGGLNPGNVAERVEAVRPRAVDVSSGVETGPGVKSLELMRAFVEAVRAV